MGPKFEFSMHLRIWLIVAASGVLLVALQMSGLPHDVARWIGAAGIVILIGLIFGPPLAELIGGRKTLLVGAVMLGLSAAIYLYFMYVVIPGVIERDNANANKHQSSLPR